MEETTDQIGRCLSDAREAAGLDVTDVMYLTRLPKSVLEALEAEDFAFFSSPTYAKSFLRQYSDFLKVDAEPWLDALEPGSYVAGQVLGPLLKEPEAPAKELPAAEASWGGFSAVWLTLVSAGMIYGAVTGYRLLEGKLGHEPEPVAERSGEAAAAEEKEAETDGQGPSLANQSKLETPKEEAAVPPRAIIVRE